MASRAATILLIDDEFYRKKDGIMRLEAESEPPLVFRFRAVIGERNYLGPGGLVLPC